MSCRMKGISDLCHRLVARCPQSNLYLVLLCTVALASSSYLFFLHLPLGHPGVSFPFLLPYETWPQKRMEERGRQQLCWFRIFILLQQEKLHWRKALICDETGIWGVCFVLAKSTPSEIVENVSKVVNSQTEALWLSSLCDVSTEKSVPWL